MRNSLSSNSNPSGVQGICPDGWHVPSDAEWTQLTTYVKSQSQYVSQNCSGNDNGINTWCIAKALASTIGWDSRAYDSCPGNNPASNNATNFSALPAGMSGTYDTTNGHYAYFWSSTENNDGSDHDYMYAMHRYLYYGSNYVVRRYNSKEFGFSVRCLKD